MGGRFFFRTHYPWYNHEMWLWIKNIVFTLVVPGTVGVYGPLWLAVRDGELSIPTWHWLMLPGALLLVSGLATFLWCLWDFASFGRGTPAPLDPPRELVVRGLYKYCRNPMYVGVLLVIVGWALVFGSIAILLYAVGVFALFNLFIRSVEEPSLTRMFGSRYDAYRASVPRWPMPRSLMKNDGLQ